MTHDFPINAYLLLLLQVVHCSCSSLVGNGLDHSIIAPIGSISYLVIDWIQKIHLMIHTIHTIHTLLHTLLTFSTSQSRRVGTSKSSSISGCIRWIFCTPARPLLSRLALQVAMYLPKARAKRQMPS